VIASRKAYTSGSGGSVLPVLALSLVTRWIGTRRVRLGVAEYRNEDIMTLAELKDIGAYRAVIDRWYRLEDVVEAHRYIDAHRKIGNVVLVVVTRLHHEASFGHVRVVLVRGHSDPDTNPDEYRSCHPSSRATDARPADPRTESSHDLNHEQQPRHTDGAKQGGQHQKSSRRIDTRLHELGEQRQEEDSELRVEGGRQPAETPGPARREVVADRTAPRRLPAGSTQGRQSQHDEIGSASKLQCRERGSGRFKDGGKADGRGQRPRGDAAHDPGDRGHTCPPAGQERVADDER
jgi:hypothetical protein